MGQSLTRAAQWTSAKGGAGGKLEFTPQNEAILNEIIKFADGFASRHPDEAKLVFKAPLSWSTTLDIGSFSGGGFRQQGEDFVSEALDDRTQTPLLKYEKDVGKNKLHVHSLEMVDKVLSIAGDKKLIETRACLEENRDPTANMLGDRFATVDGEDNSLLRFIEEMTKDASSSGDSVDEDARRDQEDKKRMLKLVLDIHQLDNKLLNMSIVAVSKETRLRPEAVATEMQVLKRFSGKDEEKHVLESIEFTDNYQYDNGCRAAPWRQMYGEIAYLLVKPHDTDEFYVTAATNGYFINKGLTEKNELDYERDGEIFRDLVTLIKTKSPHFSELIDKQSWNAFSEIRESEEAKQPPRRWRKHVLDH